MGGAYLTETLYCLRWQVLLKFFPNRGQICMCQHLRSIRGIRPVSLEELHFMSFNAWLDKVGLALGSESANLRCHALKWSMCSA